MESSDQKRRSARRFAEIPVRLVRVRGLSDAVVADINATGMFIRTSERPKLGSLLQIEVDVPDQAPVKMFVTVRHVGEQMSGHGVGVEIHVVEKNDLDRWMKFYQTLSGLHGG